MNYAKGQVIYSLHTGKPGKVLSRKTVIDILGRETALYNCAGKDWRERMYADEISTSKPESLKRG